MRCGSWECSTCARKLKACAAATIRRGAEQLPDDLALAFLTFTDQAQAALTLPALRAAWARTNLSLRRKIGMRCYALSVEVQRRGALHVHAVAAVPLETAALMRPAGVKKRSREQFAWHFGELVPLAEKLGWGPMVDAQAMREGADQAAAYVVKSLAGYATKGAGLDGFAYERLRPFRTSRDWPASFQAICAEPPADADPGPWVRAEVVT